MASPSFTNRSWPRPRRGLLVVHPSVGVVERIGPDWDWIMIDAQHGDLDLRDVAHLLRAAELVARPALVRLAGHDRGGVGRVLNAGAAGVIIPMVETVEEACAMIQAAKFPPVGNRSDGGRRAIDWSGRPLSANRATLLILQVESNEAVGIAGQLAALDGVDVLFLGPGDLVIREGRELDSLKDRATTAKQSRMVAEACRQHGKFIMGMGVSDAGLATSLADGYDFVIGAGDVALCDHGVQASLEKLRSFFRPSGPPPRA